MSKYKDLTGYKLGKLTVLEIAYKKRGNIFWDCLCECGNHCFYSTGDINRGEIKSCGCYKRNNPKKIKHGLSKTRIHTIWLNMIQRCENPNNPSYVYYGGRGISVCKDWHNFENFYKWAICNGYDEHLTLDRINVNKDYEPNNCRWASRFIQANNTRHNINITFEGEEHTLKEWSRIKGIKYNTLEWRYKKGKRGNELFKNVITKSDRG